MKVTYVNTETGKEIKYGELITYKESKSTGNYCLSSVITVPVINETIPDLIKKGIIVQKEEKADIKDGQFKYIKDKLEAIEKKVSELYTLIDGDYEGY